MSSAVFWPLSSLGTFDDAEAAEADCASNKWQMNSLNSAWTPPPSHCTSMGVISACWWESVYITSMLLCWRTKLCLNTERTWGFWQHQGQPKYFDFVFLKFWSWWLQSMAAVATAANNQQDLKTPCSIANEFSRGCWIFVQRWQEMCRTEGRKIYKIKEKSLLFWTVGCNSSSALLAAYLNTFQLRMSMSMASAAELQSHHHQAKYRLNPRE